MSELAGIFISSRRRSLRATGGPAAYRVGSEVASFVWQPKTWQRARRFIENRIKEAKLGLDNLPCRGFHANCAYLLLTLLAYNLLWLKLLALPDSERASYAKRLRFRFINLAATVGRSARRVVLRLQAGSRLPQDLSS